MWCDNKEEAKAALRANEMIEGKRQIGKTQAILEVIHEDHDGNAVVVCPNLQLADISKRRYRSLYPNEKIQPGFCTPIGVHGFVVGRDVSVYVDTFDLVRDHDRTLVCEVVRGRIVGAW